MTRQATATHRPGNRWCTGPSGRARGKMLSSCPLGCQRAVGVKHQGGERGPQDIHGNSRKNFNHDSSRDRVVGYAGRSWFENRLPAALVGRRCGGREVNGRTTLAAHPATGKAPGRALVRGATTALPCEDRLQVLEAGRRQRAGESVARALPGTAERSARPLPSRDDIDEWQGCQPHEPTLPASAGGSMLIDARGDPDQRRAPADIRGRLTHSAPAAQRAEAGLLVRSPEPPSAWVGGARPDIRRPPG